jgi:hypothetical protein
VKSTKWLKVFGLTLAASMATTTADAQLSSTVPAPGGVGLTWFGDDLTIQGISKDAWDQANLYLFRAGAILPARDGGEVPGEGIFLGSNFGPGIPLGFSALNWSITLTQASLLAANFVPGQEIIFGLYNITNPKWNYTGAAVRNAPENFFTAQTACVGGNDCSLLLEDRNPGDLDRNDFTIRVTTTPEPGTIGLLATGLIGLVGVGAARRRRNNS